MTIFHAIILGIIEGLTEFLPISSTGHLILASNILHIDQTEFLKSFEVIIQLGAVLAVLILYIKKIISNKKIIINLICAFIPTAIIGLLFYSQIKNFLGNVIIVPITLILGGLIIIWVENIVKNKEVEAINNPASDLNIDLKSNLISKKESFILGAIQTLAFIPGVSRSGAIIIGGLLRKISRAEVVEFSFMLALPTILAASGLDLVKSGFSFTQYEWLLLAIGFVTAFIVAIIAVKKFLKFITNHSFKSFGWYRIIVGIIFLFILL